MTIEVYESQLNITTRGGRTRPPRTFLRNVVFSHFPAFSLKGEGSSAVS